MVTKMMMGEPRSARHSLVLEHIKHVALDHDCSQVSGIDFRQATSGNVSSRRGAQMRG